MSTLFTLAASGMALGRIAIGIAPFIAAGPTSRMLGFPASHDTATARLMARWFGVRDIGLGVLIFWGLGHPEVLPFLFLFNMFMDLGDLTAIAVPLVKRQGIDRAAAMAALIATPAAFAWFIMWLIAR